jgi:hypothetical protein
MKTIYALVAALLALQACNSQSGTPTATVSINEQSTLSDMGGVPLHGEFTAVLSAPAITAFDDYSFVASGVQLTDDEYVATTSAIPAIKPIDGAEFEGTSRDDAYTPWSALPTGPLLDDYAIDWSIDTDHTATMISSATGTEIYLDDEGFAVTPAPIDLHASQVKDWW